MTWRRSPTFRIACKSATRHWSVNILGPRADTVKTATSGPLLDDKNVEYIPTFDQPRLFRWRGYWMEVKSNAHSPAAMQRFMVRNGNDHGSGSITITLYTRNLRVLSELVEAARQSYSEVSLPHVIIHVAESMNPDYPWMSTKRKVRRALDTIILPDGLLSSLVREVQDFMDEETERWFTSVGIPYRRGILLHGPPGTGKTSTIYALAGELNLEIYSLSLSNNFVNDSFLQRAASSVPKHSILLIEDIDCAFSREEQGSSGTQNQASPPIMTLYGMAGSGQSQVTLSGLLNVIDGVGSEEGRLFFCTTNHIDRLDPALLRPGRIDRKIEYGLSTRAQTEALFHRFFPATRFPELADTPVADEKATSSSSSMLPTSDSTCPAPPPPGSRLASLASRFAALVPEAEFSTAELQGFLLSCKTDPERAAADVGAWVAEEMRVRTAKRQQDMQKRQQKDIQANAAQQQNDNRAMHQQFGQPDSPESSSVWPMHGMLPLVGPGIAPMFGFPQNMDPSTFQFPRGTGIPAHNGHTHMLQDEDDIEEPGLDGNGFTAPPPIPAVTLSVPAEDAEDTPTATSPPSLHAPAPKVIPSVNTLGALPGVEQVGHAVEPPPFPFAVVHPPSTMANFESGPHVDFQ
ncbi:P-loop containing nucleoside triphosphate hydrolase protein [Schizophyllum commune H4-8]|uniref:P-loop containing nucleoside triphosphate hydrolase protein n=1 Tax=Schizophyllum commune (strain H4-8 / FGSC 9210) TaxID=578458 RepID=UPI00215DFADD|nr:P-loop containing nucleoside triphosphate hydrolase protein [Schizophyllum commune H4-8]KAI5900483.1 P-loop containing nucleoside triphosphate hydrolase protein [Schizophyllum commune H4-8]